jgi:hypothetical protein
MAYFKLHQFGWHGVISENALRALREVRCEHVASGIDDKTWACSGRGWPRSYYA